MLDEVDEASISTPDKFVRERGGVLGPSTANIAVTTQSCTPGRLAGKTYVSSSAATATRQAQQERQHETGKPPCQEKLKGKAATDVDMIMSNSPSLESEVELLRKTWGGLKHDLQASITALKKEKAKLAAKLRLTESISKANEAKAARWKELVEQIYADTKATEVLKAQTIFQIAEADARPSRSAVSAEMESLKAKLQRTHTALKESEASRRNAENLLKNSRKAADATRERLVEANKEFSASHADRHHACADLKALQASLVEAKDGARNSQQIAKEDEENTGMKRLQGHTTNQSKSKDKARHSPHKDGSTSSVTTSCGDVHGGVSVGCLHGPSSGVNGGLKVTPTPTPAERIGYSAATPASARCEPSNLVQAKTIPTSAPGFTADARSLESPSPARAPLAFGGHPSRSTLMVSSASDTTGGFSFSADSGATLTSTTAGQAFKFGRMPGAVGDSRPQGVTGKPVVGGVVGLPSPAFGKATPAQQPQWKVQHHLETAMSLPSTLGGPRDTSTIPEDRLASLPSAHVQEATRLARSQLSTPAKPARERFENSVVDATGNSGSVAQGGTTATGTDISRAEEAQLGKRGGAVDEAEEDDTRRVDLQKGGHTVILLDVKTTGPYPFESRLIQLAAKVLDSKDPNPLFSAYVKPGATPVPVEIQELTGITPQLLAANNAQPFRETWARFASWLTKVVPKGAGGGVVMVVHNASFDHGFVVSELVRAGLDRFTMGKLGIVAFVDSLAVLRDKRMWQQHLTDVDAPIRPTNFKLGGLFEHLFGHEMPGGHNALGDVQGLERILSAPGIAGRWRLVASTHPTCQITGSQSGKEHDAAHRRLPKDQSSKKQKPTLTKKGVGVPPDDDTRH